MTRMWINRSLEDVLRQQVAIRPVLVLTGTHQSGKTSLLKKLFPDYNFVSLDLPTTAAQADQNPEQFFKEHEPPLIIDEAQYAPHLFRYLKTVIDNVSNLKSQLIVTGSQKFLLMKEVSDLLVGRATMVDFDPLSYQEMHAFNRQMTFDRCMLCGGYPELHIKNLEPYAFFQSHVATYLKCDLHRLLHVSNLSDFEQFLRCCAQHSGQVLNKSNLAKEIGISAATARQWLAALEMAGLISFLKPWVSSASKTTIKTPKMYLCDTGILCFLLNIQSEEQLRGSPFIGQIWETFIYSELIKRLHVLGHGHNLYYWRDHSHEINFLYLHAGEYTIATAKYTEKPTEDDCVGLHHVAAVLGDDKIAQRCLFTCATRVHAIDQRTMNMPVSKIAEFL